MSLQWAIIGSLGVFFYVVILLTLLYAHGDREAEREATYIDVRAEQ